MKKSSPTINAGQIASVDDSIDRLPWGIYVPPAIEIAEDQDIVKNDDGRAGGGYVRIVDSRGKSFPCGFSRHVGSVSTATEKDEIAGKTRSRRDFLEKTSFIDNDGDECVDEELETKPTHKNVIKLTTAEERIHPEEALFLHMRGLLRIESISHHNITYTGTSTSNLTKTMSTQDLFCIMLPECKIPLAVFLAYAHLRAQGYILIRYSDQRMKLLFRMQRQTTKLEKETPQTNVTICQTNQMNEQPVNDGGRTQVKSSWERFRTRPLRLLLSDDVATAPPPCVVSYPNASAVCVEKLTNNLRLAYYAYNPNAHFKRSNPGIPNFGVVVMPFRSEPTFDALTSLVSLIEEGGDGGENWDCPRQGIPLRVVTVADSGAVIVFGVTNGDVPNISDNKSKAEK